MVQWHCYHWKHSPEAVSLFGACLSCQLRGNNSCLLIASSSGKITRGGNSSSVGAAADYINHLWVPRTTTTLHSWCERLFPSWWLHLSALIYITVAPVGCFWVFEVTSIKNIVLSSENQLEMVHLWRLDNTSTMTDKYTNANATKLLVNGLVNRFSDEIGRFLTKIDKLEAAFCDVDKVISGRNPFSHSPTHLVSKYDVEKPIRQGRDTIVSGFLRRLASLLVTSCMKQCLLDPRRIVWHTVKVVDAAS